MRRHFDNFITSAIEWLWRKRSTGLKLIGSGIALLFMLLGANWGISFIYPTSSVPFQFSLNVNQETPAYLNVGVLAVAVLLIFVGLFLLIIEEHKLGKKRAVAIELRGLRDTAGKPLKDRIPHNIVGRREQILVNIRRSDGRILDPEDALQQVAHLPTSIAHFEAGADRSDITYVAGGLAPVPFSFLMGVLLDDEGSVTLMDWNRNVDDWRSLDGDDDGDRFAISGVDSIGQAEEIVLNVSVSYPTNLAGITQTFAGQPIISMALKKLATDGHWSESKQAALAQEFFDAVRALCGTHVKRVNLVLAAPNSIVIRFGRIYDKRNLPSINVWQYENGHTPPYPWGVSMPVAGNRAEIVRH